MIHAEFKDDDSGLHVSIKGHAGHAQKGYDIVCSAVSIIANMMARMVYAELDSYQEPPAVKLEEGDTEIHIKPVPEKRGLFAYTLVVLEMGIDSIAQVYPECVELKSFGQTSKKV